MGRKRWGKLPKRLAKAEPPKLIEPQNSREETMSGQDSSDFQNPLDSHKQILETLVAGGIISSEKFKSLVMKVDHLDVIAKVFLLEGTPFVFAKSPMRYMVFREQVADRFHVGYQDVCIVGSAKLGFSPSPTATKFGRAFAEESDVDVVIISEEMFDEGTLNLFEHLNRIGPHSHILADSENEGGKSRRTRPRQHSEEPVEVVANDWRRIKEGIRNYVYQNFNPGLLPDTDKMKLNIFQRIRSTTPLFLALEPTVFVSKIRCRIFRNWKAAESYYTNSLRLLRRHLQGEELEYDPEEEENDGLSPAEIPTAAK